MKRPPAPSSAHSAATRDRFLSGPMATGFALYGLFAATFAYFQVRGDALVYFNLLRRFFGEEPDFAYAYQFGSALWNTPFFLVGKTFGILFGFQPRIFHVSFEEVSLTLAAQAALVVTLYLGWRILGELGLPRGPAVLFLTLFGTPLFFYVIFDPAGKHAVDTLVLTAATYAFLRRDAMTEARAALVLGALCGWSLNIRWANVAFFAALLAALLLRRRQRLVGLAAGTAAAVAVVILALPALRGIEYFFPVIRPPTGSQAIARVAAPAEWPLAAVQPLDDSDPQGFFDPTIPAHMLFSDHRGLFLWTPLTAIAALGFGLALVRARRAGDGFFLTSLLAAALALLCIHMFWPRWDGGFAFSTRFLTGLFPLFLIGVAEVVRRKRAWAYPALAVAAAFSVAIAFVHDYGYDGISERDDLSRVVEAGYENRHSLRLDLQNDAKARWVYLSGLLEGRDSKCIREPPGTTDC